MDHRAQGRAGLVDRAIERHLAAGDDRHALAQSLRMGDHMGREKDGRAAVRLLADQLLEPGLVDGVEAGEGLVEDDQPRPVDDGAEQLDCLRHALGEGADRLSGPLRQAVAVEQGIGAATPFGDRQTAQGAHEGDRLA